MRTRAEVVYDATIEVAPAVVTAVATTIVSFLPVFFLTGRDYRLFSPLAYTKTFAIAAAMMTAVTIVPALSRLMLRSANYRKRTALVAGLAFAGLMSAASSFSVGFAFRRTAHGSSLGWSRSGAVCLHSSLDGN